MATLIDLHDELEKGEIIRDMGMDDYTAVRKNKYGKYVYTCDMEPEEYFLTFDELVAHTEGYVVQGQNLTLEDINIDHEDWEVEPDPPADVMERNNMIMAAIAQEDEPIALLFAYKRYIQGLRGLMDKDPLLNNLDFETGIAEDEKRATKLFFEVANRSRSTGEKTASLPEWRMQYQALLMEGEKEQAEYLWDAEIRKGMQSVQERMFEPLREAAAKHLRELKRDIDGKIDLNALFPGLMGDEEDDEESEDK
jgi:hypothetical protein